jgi:hypothetical protein
MQYGTVPVSMFFELYDEMPAPKEASSLFAKNIQLFKHEKS